VRSKVFEGYLTIWLNINAAFCFGKHFFGG